MTGRTADRLIDYVRNSRITEAVILTSFHQSPLPLALLLRLAGVERITGASTDYAGSLLDVRLRPGEDFPEDQPEAERALGIARAAGFRAAPRATTASSGCQPVPDVPEPGGRRTLRGGPSRGSRPGQGLAAAAPRRRRRTPRKVRGTGWW